MSSRSSLLSRRDAALAPLRMVMRELSELRGAPGPLRGALFGVVVGAAFVMFVVVVFRGPDHEVTDAMDIEFTPGALVRLGGERAGAGANVGSAALPDERSGGKPDATVTKDPERRKSRRPDTRPAPKSGRNQAGAGGSPQTPIVGDDEGPPDLDGVVGSPFGDAAGWADVARSGDPWATEVMAALNGLDLPSWAAEGFEGSYHFKIRVCKDGRIDKVLKKRATGDLRIDAALRLELSRVNLPPVPARHAGRMSANCQLIPYTFVWSRGQVR